MSVESEKVLEVAEGLIASMRESAELLTGDGWDLAYAAAITQGKIHTARRIKDAKALALYRGEDK
jgi:hypothetical protein